VAWFLDRNRSFADRGQHGRELTEAAPTRKAHQAGQRLFSLHAGPSVPAAAHAAISYEEAER
jgi:hypothetical protein